MNDKQELLELLNRIILYFEIQGQYGGIEKDIFNHYKMVRDNYDKCDFKGIDFHNWPRAYLEANSDWNNPILEAMEKADKLVEYFQKMT